MSDLADAVFGGQLLGHLIAGEELTTSVIADAAIQADLASSLVVNEHLSEAAQEIIRAKISQSVIENGSFEHADLIDAQLDSDLAEGLF
jgi:hypothetical protein